MSAILQIALFVFPWRIRRWLLCRLFDFRIDPTARIGFSLLRVAMLDLGPHARISHLTYAKGLRCLVLGEHAILGPLNWITAYPAEGRDFFTHVVDREPSLVIGRHAAVTGRHLLDCTAGITVDPFATVGGWGSQILTHSIDIATGRQDAAGVRISDYCFVGTRVVVLKGARLPPRSVLAAGSVYSIHDDNPGGLFSGIPATRVRELDPDMAYFCRSRGFVH